MFRYIIMDFGMEKICHLTLLYYVKNQRLLFIYLGFIFIINIFIYVQSFIIGEGDVLSGIEEAVKTMTQGEEAEFLVSYKLLFGEAGCPPRIKPKADALFFIQVIRVIEGYKDSVMYKSQQQTEKKFEEVYKLAKSLHQNGLEAFKASNLDSAVRYFHKAATMLEFSKQTCPEEEEMQKSLLIKLYTNLAVCYNRKNCPKKACTMCNEVRRITNINTQVKTLYQHGIALQNLGEYERAKTMLMKAKKLKPTDEDINKRLVTILAIVDQGNKQEKDMCARIFQLESKEPSVKENDETNQIYGDNKIVDILEQFKTSTNKELTFSSFLAQKDVDLIKTLLASSMYNNMVLQKSSDKYVLKKK